MRRRYLVSLGVIVCLSLWASPAQGASITFVPADQSVPVGSMVDVQVWISGLGDGSAPSLGAFDLGVSFDQGILDPTGVTFGSFLGGPADSVSDSDFSTPGIVDFFEVSFLFPDELDLLQPASFVLATLSFNAIAAGTSALEFLPLNLPDVLSDAFGASISATLGSGSIEVTQAVPEPATGLLLGVGLLVAYRRTKGRQRE